MDVTCEDFLGEVCGKKKKPEWEALTTLFGEIVTGRSELVSDLSAPLRKNAGAADRKRVQERVSGRPSRHDFIREADGWLLKNTPGENLDARTFAVDLSGISKVFGGEGMEDMAMGRDGSTGETRMGRDFICVPLVGADCQEALPVYVKLGRGRNMHAETPGNATGAIMAQTGGKGWIAEDRGMDGAKHFRDLKILGRKSVIRVKDVDRDVFGDGLKIDESVRSAGFFDPTLHVRTGARRAKIRCRRGAVQCCANPKSKNAATENIDVPVVESRFNEKSICLCVIRPDDVLASPTGTVACARRAAQAYCDRWQIETPFFVMKQEFALEKARVRTFRRLENIFTPCVMAYVHATRFLRRTKGFWKTHKLLSDNLEAVSAKTHALLAGVRALVNMVRVRFISGRPRKNPKADDRRMLLPWF